jgi:hypothetical protein
MHFAFATRKGGVQLPLATLTAFDSFMTWSQINRRGKGPPKKGQGKRSKIKKAAAPVKK